MKKKLETEYLNNDRADNFFFLRNEFIYWLKYEEEYTHGSANSYASYVASVNKNILAKHLKGGSFFSIVEEVVNVGNKIAVEDLFDPLISIVLAKTPASLVHKYKNGLIQYRNFLIVQLSEEDLVDDIEPFKPALIASKENTPLVFLKESNRPNRLSFDKDALRKIFTLRMITQDRCYGNVFFPISFLKKLFYKNKASRIFFDEYIENQINNILLHTDGGTHKLFDINLLTIGIRGDDRGLVKIVCKDNNSVILYTKIGTGDEQAPINATALRNIAIDHVFPMKLILAKQETNLPVLKQITQAFISSERWKKDNGKLKVKMIKYIGNDLLNKNLFNQSDIPALKRELEHIQSFIKLQLMDAKENLIKKAKFNRIEEKYTPLQAN
jgi:hypothetical protein